MATPKGQIIFGNPLFNKAFRCWSDIPHVVSVSVEPTVNGVDNGVVISGTSALDKFQNQNVLKMRRTNGIFDLDIFRISLTQKVRLFLYSKCHVKSRSNRRGEPVCRI